MTKEEILATKHWNSEYPNYMAESEILDAMDEYAKQQAIEFVAWLLDNNEIVGDSHSVAYMPSNPKDTYKKFIQSKETNNGK